VDPNPQQIGVAVSTALPAVTLNCPSCQTHYCAAWGAELL